MFLFLLSCSNFNFEIRSKANERFILALRKMNVLQQVSKEEIVRIINEDNPDFNIDIDGETPLTIAIKSQNIELIDYLLEICNLADTNGGKSLVNVNLKNREGQSPLVVAAMKGDLESVKKLLTLKSPASNVRGQLLEDLLYEMMHNSTNYAQREQVALYLLKARVKIYQRAGSDVVKAKNKLLDDVLNSKSILLLLELVNEFEYTKEELEQILKRCLSFTDMNIEILDILIKKAEMSYKDALILVINHSASVEIIGVLIDKSGCSKEFLGELLISRLESRNREVISLLIEKGAALGRDENGKIAVIAAIKMGDIEMIKLIISKMSSLDVKDRDGRTLLMIAVATKEESIINIFLDLNDKDRAEMLMKEMLYEMQQNSKLYSDVKEVVKYLIGKGIGKNLLNEAFKTKDKEIITMLKDRSENDKEFLGKVLISQLESGNREEINLLIERGASVNERSEKGMSALMIASQQGDLKLVKEIIIKKVKIINEKTEIGFTALMFACSGGHLKIVRALLQAGAKVDEKDETGLTALMIASKNGHEKIVSLLLQARANVDEENLKGESALMLARQNCHETIVSLLLQAGAKE